MDLTETIEGTQLVARDFAPVAVGRSWILHTDSFIVKALEPWPPARRFIQSITIMLEEFGMLQADTFDNEPGVCVRRYREMVSDLGNLVTIIKTEMVKG